MTASVLALLNDLYDVIAVNIETGATRTIAERKSERNADAIIAMAVMRRGTADEFFKAVLRGDHAGHEANI